MSQFGNKTTPWARSHPTPGLQQAFQSAMGMQQPPNIGIGLQQMANGPIFQQVGAVTYPNPRSLNPTAFQAQSIQAVPPVPNSASQGAKQRFFTGTVTKVHDNFGFVDEDVFFQTNACVKGSNPMVGDRVLVEATFNPSMPFKWNATRIQVLPTTNQSTTRHSNNSNKNYSGSNNNYNTVPPPNDNPSNNGNFGRPNRSKALIGGRGRERSRERERDEDEIERKRRREERVRERDKEEKKSPIRRRTRSPKSRRRSRIVPRYMVQIPKIALDMPNADVLEVRRRYTNIYIPSDFFFTHIRWVDAFPPDKPFTLNKPCSFHIMAKDVEPITENDAVLEPSDADYIFSAKVMLMSVPGVEELYQKCCALAEDKDRRDRDSEERDYVHPTRLVNFLVGLRGKNETMAIGGPWSPSLDGDNPETDPSVLIKTAIRTCKALTGIDLSSCTQWYRFVELYYRRGESTHKGRSVPARVETVVVYLPDVWMCLPTRLEWDGLQLIYRKELDRRLNVQAAPAAEDSGEAAPADDQPQTTDEKEEDTIGDKLEPTHYSQLDTKTMTVVELKNELMARTISCKGLKSQLVARLNKALKSEMEKTDESASVQVKSENTESEGEAGLEETDKKMETEEKQLDEKEKALLEKRYTLPEQQHIIVHPSKTAKSGKFDCTTMSLSLLLDYRPEDTKEHSFEVSLFAELFNEMLMRDFGFNVFRALHDLPDKAKEKDDKKRREEDKKKEDEKKKKEPGAKEDDKKKEDAANSTEVDKKSDDTVETKSEGKDEDKKAKKDDKRTDESEEDEDNEEDDAAKKKDKDKRKKERVKLYTTDKHLLLSFVYFDQTHCGYIFDKDIEDLLYTLGLNLSRAQVRKLVSKVVTRDSLHYRKLTDKPWDDDFIVIDDSEKETNVHELAAGNKQLLPVFQKEDSVRNDSSGETPTTDDGLVMFRGALMDVSKLLLQLERSEKARLETESRMVDLKSENTRLSDKCTKSNSTIKTLNGELKDYKEKLKSTEDSLGKATSFSKMYLSTLSEIRDTIEPVLKNTTKEESPACKKEDKDKKHEESKSRWEKDLLKEESGADSEEVKKESN